MNVRELQDLSTIFGVRVITEEYRYMRLAVKVVGGKEDAANFLKTVQAQLPIFVALYSVSSQFVLLAEIKFLFLKLKAGLRERDQLLINSVCPQKNVRAGINVK